MPTDYLLFFHLTNVSFFTGGGSHGITPGLDALVFLRHVPQNDDDWNMCNHRTDRVAPTRVRRERLHAESVVSGVSEAQQLFWLIGCGLWFAIRPSPFFVTL